MKKRLARKKSRGHKQVLQNVIKIFSIMAACFILLTILSNVARRSEQDQSVFAQIREFADLTLEDQTSQPVDLAAVEETIATKEGELISKEVDAQSESIFPKDTAERSDLFAPSPELPDSQDEFVIEDYLASLESNQVDQISEEEVAPAASASNSLEEAAVEEIEQSVLEAEPNQVNLVEESLAEPELIQNQPPQVSEETNTEPSLNKHAQISSLPKIPALGTLSIPSIHLNVQTKEIPLIGNNWSLFELDDDVGVLEGAGQYPNDNLSMVFAAHVTTIWPFKGPFGNLYRTSLGDEIRYTDENNVYIYKISRYIYAHPSRVDLLFKEDGDQIILVTCNGYNLVTDNFDNRLITYATLDRVIPIATIEEFASE